MTPFENTEGYQECGHQLHGKRQHASGCCPKRRLWETLASPRYDESTTWLKTFFTDHTATAL